MDQVTVLRTLDGIANVMRRFGLRRIVRHGRDLAKPILRNDVSVNFDGLLMSGATEHWRFLYQVQSTQFEPLMSALFKDAVKPEMAVLDLGAFLGYYTLLAAKAGATVYAFEPDPRTFPYLMRNIRENGFNNRVTAVAKAISDRVGIVSYFINKSADLSSLFDGTGNVEKKDVECITLDAFPADSGRIGVIKMDLQGAELHALEGMERTINRVNGHLTMFVECWPRGLRITGGTAESLIQKLRDFGFSVNVIDEATHRLSPVSRDIELVKYVNLYCTK